MSLIIHYMRYNKKGDRYAQKDEIMLIKDGKMMEFC